MKKKIRMFVNLLMTCFLLLQMSYSMIGEDRHVWHGIILLILFVIHNILNLGFYKSLFRGSFLPFRLFQILLAFLAVLSMTGAMISGISLVPSTFPFFPLRLRGSTARELHMVCAYWGFVILSMHLGLHWGTMLGRMRKKIPVLQTAKGTIVLRVLGVLIAGYGVYAFIKREIGYYMTLKIVFAFFDFEEPLILFLLDYLAVMGLFVWIGYYVAEWLKKIPKRSKKTL